MDSVPHQSPAGHSTMAAAAATLSQRAKLEILGAVLLGLFLAALDQTIVGTALPRIVTELQGNDYYTWVVTIYLLTSTITIPFYGKLSDLYGRKPLLMIGIGLFLAGSALSGLSQEMWQLILFRGIQGLGGGALFPIALAIIGDLFSPAERGKYQGLFGAVFGISFLIGPALGGFLTDAISWHWVFYVNLPVGFVSLYVIWRLLPNIRRPEVAHSLDYPGAVLFTAGIGFLLVGLTNKSAVDPATHQVNDWTSPAVLNLVVVGVALLAAFVLVEARAKEPIVPLGLWRNRTYAASVLSSFFLSFGFFGAVIFLPRWFQVVRGQGATESGYQMLPLLAGLILSSIISGQAISRTGRYRVIVVGGIAVMAFGTYLMTGIRADTPLPLMWAWMFVTGVGIGPTMAGFTLIVQNAAPVAQLGVATGNLSFFRQIGGSVGLAVLGTVFGTALREQLPTQVRPVMEEMVASAPPAAQGQLAGLLADLSTRTASLDLNAFTGVGQSFGGAVASTAARAADALQAGAGAAVTQLFAPFVGRLDHAFFEAFSLAMGQVFAVGLVATLVAVVLGLGVEELPLRSVAGHGQGLPSRHAAGPTQAAVPGTEHPSR
jgi:EmrB/QacA subfamily drug resistance transporter